MGETLKYSNNSLITLNNLISTCCCDGQEISYEGVPCEIAGQQRAQGSCTDNEQCDYANRIWVGVNTQCQGAAFGICECKLFTFESFFFDTFPYQENTNDRSVILGNASFSFALTLTVTNSGMMLLYNGVTYTFNFTIDTTIDNIGSWIGSSTGFNGYLFANLDTSGSDHPTIITPGTYIVDPFSDITLTLYNGQLKERCFRIYAAPDNIIDWNLFEDVAVSDDEVTLSSNLGTAISDLTGDDIGIKYWENSFSDLNVAAIHLNNCGVAKDNFAFISYIQNRYGKVYNPEYAGIVDDVTDEKLPYFFE